MAENTKDDVPVQDKGYQEKEIGGKEGSEEVAEREEQEVKANSKDNYRQLTSNDDLRAVGVRPQDLAKHSQSFYIHSELPDCYVKFSRSASDYGYVETQKSYVGDATLFALEDAGSGSYYIKARDQDDNMDLGYLYLSDKKSGMLGSRLNNIMWSHDKQEKPNFKFEFECNKYQYGNHRIYCQGMALVASAGRSKYLRATPEELDCTEGYFELNMPECKEMKVESPLEMFNRSAFNEMIEMYVGAAGKISEKRRIKPKYEQSKSEDTEVVTHKQLQPSGILSHSASSCFTPQKDCQYYYVADGALLEQKLLITLNQKEFVGWQVIQDDPGSMLEQFACNECRLLSLFQYCEVPSQGSEDVYPTFVRYKYVEFDVLQGS